MSYFLFCFAVLNKEDGYDRFSFTLHLLGLHNVTLFYRFRN